MPQWLDYRRGLREYGASLSSLHISGGDYCEGNATAENLLSPQVHCEPVALLLNSDAGKVGHFPQ